MYIWINYVSSLSFTSAICSAWFCLLMVLFVILFYFIDWFFFHFQNMVCVFSLFLFPATFFSKLKNIFHVTKHFCCFLFWWLSLESLNWSPTLFTYFSSLCEHWPLLSIGLWLLSLKFQLSPCLCFLLLGSCEFRDVLCWVVVFIVFCESVRV